MTLFVIFIIIIILIIIIIINLIIIIAIKLVVLIVIIINITICIIIIIAFTFMTTIWKQIIVITLTWYLCPNFGALSVSTLATFASLSRRLATSSKIGSIIWQGPHHLADAENRRKNEY